MKCNAKYSEVCDLAPVDQFGFVDLNECLAYVKSVGKKSDKPHE